MPMLVSQEPPETLSQSERAALISLLVDEDPAIYQMVRGKILSYGPVVCEWLQPHMLSSDPVMRRRALEIVNHLARKGSDEKFLDFCHHNGEELDLEMAAGLLAQTQHSDTNNEGYQALSERSGFALRTRISSAAEAGEKLSLINRSRFSQPRIC